MDEFEEELKSLESQLDIAKAQLEIYENAKGSLEVEKQALLKKEAEVQKGFQQTLFEIQSDLKREGYLKATDFQNSLEQLMGAENQLKLSNLELELADSPSSRNQIEKQKYEVDALEYTLECKKSMLEQRKRKSALTVEKAELALKEAEFKVASLKQYIRFASMKAEKDGVFIVNESWKNGKLTAFVEGDQVWPGTLVGRLVNLENFYISGQLAEEAFYELNPGQSVSFTLTGKEEKQYPGKLKKVASIPKKVWGGSNEPMIDVEIEVHAKSVLFQPGASVRYEVQVSESRQAVSIPHLALYEQSGEFFVFLDAAGKEKRKVVPGAKRGDRVEIVSGLTAGTEVFWMEWE
jgi:multidrug efflux pump subunit AcrA (membrane-fusion protein)